MRECRSLGFDHPPRATDRRPFFAPSRSPRPSPIPSEEMAPRLNRASRARVEPGWSRGRPPHYHGPAADNSTLAASQTIGVRRKMPRR